MWPVRVSTTVHEPYQDIAQRFPEAVDRNARCLRRSLIFERAASASGLRPGLGSPQAESSVIAGHVRDSRLGP